MTAIAADFEYPAAAFKPNDNERGLKLPFLVNMLMYCVCGVSIKNCVGAAADPAAANDRNSPDKGRTAAADEPEAGATVNTLTREAK